MNHVIEAQAQVIANYVDANDSLSCHLFLENQHMPLKLQDKILAEVGRLQIPSAGNIAKIIDRFY